MLFNSVEYLFLLFLSLIAYWSVSSITIRQLILFFASVYFYMSWSTTFIFLLVLMISINWLIGFRLYRDGRVIWLYASIFINLLSLCFFKYINFILDNMFSAAGLFFKDIPAAPYMSIILPLGISFYTFEVISYLIDIHRRQTEPEKNFIVFSLFIIFFPHLIAGPICRKNQFIPQIKTKILFNFDNLYKGCFLFLSGFVLKTSVADGMASYVNVIFNYPARYSGLENIFGVIGFGIQIFCDFWGYSLMAIGAALLFGIALPLNFNAPYLALSIRDFWRRWHITLSNWLRDYLYKSIGGSKGIAEWKVYRNLIVTMLLGGLWHGASWNFIIWGGIHGVALAVNRYWGLLSIPVFIRSLFRAPFVAWSLTMLTVFVAWIFFRASTFDNAMTMLSKIFQPDDAWFANNIPSAFYEIVVIFFVVHYLSVKIERADFKEKTKFSLASMFMLIYIGAAYYVDGSDFIYFQF